jgi:hypothetical protein
LATALTVSRAAATTAAFAVFAVTSVAAALTLAISVLGPVTPVAARVKPAVVSFGQRRRRGRWGWWRAHGRGRTQTTLSFRGVVVAGSWASHLRGPVGSVTSVSAAQLLAGALNPAQVLARFGIAVFFITGWSSTYIAAAAAFAVTATAITTAAAVVGAVLAALRLLCAISIWLTDTIASSSRANCLRSGIIK